MLRCVAGKQAEYVKVGECLYRNAQSGIYYALLKRSGKQIRRSLRTPDRALAKRRLADLRGQLERLSPSEGDRRVLFEAVAENWLKIAHNGHKARTDVRRRASVKQLLPYFGGKAVRSVTLRDCQEWQVRRGEGISAATFNKERDALIGVLDLAVQSGLLLDNPARKIGRRRLAKKEIVIPSRAQFAELVRAIRAVDPKAKSAADLVELLGYSGMRVGEATALRWQDVDFENGRFVVTGGETGTKNHEARVVPLFPALRELLERLWAEPETEPQPSDRVIGIASAKKALETASRRTGLPHFTHHSMRHYFVSNAIEAGIDFKTIAAWVGHKDGGILVAQTYGHLRDPHSFEMAQRMTFSAS